MSLEFGNLTETLSVSDIVLPCFHSGRNVAIDHYEIYRETDPGFTPGGGNKVQGTKGTSYEDAGAAGTVGTNYFTWSKRSIPVGIWPMIPSGRVSSISIYRVGRDPSQAGIKRPRKVASSF